MGRGGVGVAAVSECWLTFFCSFFLSSSSLFLSFSAALFSAADCPSSAHLASSAALTATLVFSFFTASFRSRASTAFGLLFSFFGMATPTRR